MYLAPATRARHLHIIGQTGMGKSALMQSMLFEDIERGDGVGVIDPHGSLAEAVIRYVPSWRKRDLIYLNAQDRERPVQFNPLSDIDKGHSVATDNMLSAFIHVFGGDAIGPRSQQVLRNSIRILLDIEEPSLLCVPKLLTDKVYRTSVLEKTKDPFVKSYWTDQFDRYTDRFREEVVSPILNKLDAFLSSPEVRNIIAGPSTFSFREVMDDQKIFVANLSKAELGEQNSHLLGALLVTATAQAAFSRTEPTKPFYLFVDEFQNFATSSFSTILSESRKYGLSLTLAHQFLDQLDSHLRNAVFGNTGTVVCFRIGAIDAPLMASHLGWKNPETLSDLQQFHARVRVFPGDSLDVATAPPPVGRNPKSAVRESRNNFGRERAKIENKIRLFLRS